MKQANNKALSGRRGARLRRAALGLRPTVRADTESALAVAQPHQPAAIKPPPARLGHTAKVCQKTHNSGTFLPLPSQPASKIVIENKDTKG